MFKKIGDPDPSDSTYHTGIVMGIVVGALFMVAGFTLCILGLTGSIEWLLEGGGLKSRLTNGSPGIVFAIIGLAVVWRYKPKITHSTTNKTETTEVKSAQSSGGTSYTRTSIVSQENRTSGARLSQRK